MILLPFLNRLSLFNKEYECDNGQQITSVATATRVKMADGWLRVSLINVRNVSKCRILGWNLINGRNRSTMSTADTHQTIDSTVNIANKLTLRCYCH